MGTDVLSTARCCWHKVHIKCMISLNFYYCIWHIHVRTHRLCIPYTIPSPWTTISADETQPGVSAIHGIRQNEFLGPALSKWATNRNHYKNPTDLSMESPYFWGWPPSLFQSNAPKTGVMWVAGAYNLLNSFSHEVYRNHISSKRCRVFFWFEASKQSPCKKLQRPPKSVFSSLKPWN